MSNLLKCTTTQLGSLHSTLKMETVYYAETLVVTREATTLDNPEYWANTKLSYCFGPRLPLCTVYSKDSSVGIATRYGLDGPGIESRWG